MPRPYDCRFLLGSSFQQPVFLTLCHMAASSLVPLLAMATRTGPKATPLTRAQLGRLAVLSLVFCTSVVLGNVALKFLHVSFFQVRYSMIHWRLQFQPFWF